MPIFEKLFDDVKGSVPDLAESHLNGLAGQASAIMNDYLDKTKDDLRSYSLLLAAGIIGEEDYRTGVHSKLYPARMELLQVKGFQEAAIEEFIESVINAFLESALKVLLFKPIKP